MLYKPILKEVSVTCLSQFLKMFLTKFASNIYNPITALIAESKWTKPPQTNRIELFFNKNKGKKTQYKNKIFTTLKMEKSFRKGNFYSQSELADKEFSTQNMCWEELSGDFWFTVNMRVRKSDRF